MLCLILCALLVPPSHGHPADDFCTPGGGLDPALCRSLSDLDSADIRADGPLADAPLTRHWTETLLVYLWIGIRHILPGGSDHILFVVALFLAARRAAPLALHISTFTVAHTATIGLTAAGLVHPPEALVTPLIAATIAIVGIEGAFAPRDPPWRVGLVFVFGLVHGLGFAGAFAEAGLPEGQFWPALIAFNLGVEVGQIATGLAAVAAAASLRAALPKTPLASDAGYRTWIVRPLTLAIGATGLVWMAISLTAGGAG